MGFNYLSIGNNLGVSRWGRNPSWWRWREWSSGNRKDLGAVLFDHSAGFRSTSRHFSFWANEITC